MRPRAIVRAAAAVAMGWFVATSPGGNGRIAVRAPSVILRAAGQDCGCPPMPVVATSKDPAKGQVQGEYTLAQLEKLFSNRHAMFARGWDDGFVALAHDLDPSGALKIWDRPRPAADPRIRLEEGVFSGLLLNPPTIGGPPRPGVTRPEVFLIHTLARINKYGEPEQGLRAAVLAALRFLTDDLANIPSEVTQGNPKALFLRAIAYNARQAVNGYVSLARPDALKRRLARGGGAAALVRESDRAELKLEDLDLANAALDVYWAIDDQKRDYIMRIHDDDLSYIVGNLADIASARSAFGGNLVAGAAQDAVACRAYSILATFADPRLIGSRPVRTELQNVMFADGTHLGAADANAPRFNATRAAFLLAGIADTAEADALVQGIFGWGLAGLAVEPWELEVATTLRALPLYTGGDRDTFRGYMADKINARMEEFQRRQDGGVNGTREEQHFIDLWKASAGRVAIANPYPPCGAEPGESSGRIILYAVCADGLQVIDELYLGVSTVVEVQFDAESDKSKKEAPIELSIGGQTVKLTAHRYDDHGRIFRTDPIVPGTSSAPLKKEDAFDPAPPPKREGQ